MKCLLSFFLFTFLSFIVNAQNPQLHIEGHIRSDSLAGNLNRVLVADPQGNISAEMADTMKLRVIQLIDDNGEVRLEMDANKGHFQMLDNDSVFHEIKVLSPPTMKQRISETESRVTTSDPLLIGVIKDQLNDETNPSVETQEVLDIINMGNIVSVEFAATNNDIEDLEDDIFATDGFVGSFFLQNADGVYLHISFSNTGDFEGNRNQNLQVRELGLSVFNGDPFADVDPFEKLNSIATAEAVQSPMGFGFSGTTDSGEEVQFNNGLFAQGNNPFEAGLEFQNCKC